MPPIKKGPNPALVDMLRAARELKGRDMGRRGYTFEAMVRDIEDRTGHKRIKGNLSHIFKGTYPNPDPDMLRDIAIVLDLDPDDVLVAGGWAPDSLRDAVTARVAIEQENARRERAGQQRRSVSDLLADESLREDEDFVRLVRKMRAALPRVNRLIRGRDPSGSDPPASDSISRTPPTGP